MIIVYSAGKSPYPFTTTDLGQEYRFVVSVTKDAVTFTTALTLIIIGLVSIFCTKKYDPIAEAMAKNAGFAKIESNQIKFNDDDGCSGTMIFNSSTGSTISTGHAHIDYPVRYMTRY